MSEIILYYLVAVNITTLLVYGIDKLNAMRNAARVPERTLLALALAGGSSGALAAVYIFRHKTKKRLFTILLPLFLILHLLLLAYLAL